MRAKRVMKCSLRDLFSAACSTSSRIREAVDSPKALVVRTRRTPSRLTHPERISSPAATFRGMLSPVRATVSRDEAPSRTMPSMGTFSPGRMRRVSPGATLSQGTFCRAPSRSTLAVSGRISSRWATERRERPSAIPSNSSPTWKKSMTNTASGNWVAAPGRNPMPRAPSVAMPIRKFSSRASPWARASAASHSVSQPAMR